MTSPWARRLGEPRNAVLVLLAAALLFGGGRRWLSALRTRALLQRLDDPGVTPEIILSASGHGRRAVMDLFRLLETGATAAHREAAGRALAVLWAEDELIAEEEKAVVRRGFLAEGGTRRVYPRALRAEVPVVMTFGVPFLETGGPGVGPASLEWSFRVTGARRASLEVFSDWKAGPGRAEFGIVPGDFSSGTRHHLVLHARARTVGLGTPWEFELPHIRFASIEFDPNLTMESLYALPDEARGEVFRRGIRLVRGEATEGAEAPWLRLGEGLALRDPPRLEVDAALPCDLAHRVEFEFEGAVGRHDAGRLVIHSSAGLRSEPSAPVTVALGDRVAMTEGTIDAPGPRRARVWLTADLELGWSDPEVRSVWPEALVTNWVDLEILRV